MKRALNRWLFDGGGYYIQVTPASTADLKSKVTVDIVIGWMVASDMYERLNGPHYNNHPNKPISHWTTIRGYSGYGSTMMFQDPAANSPALGTEWDDANPFFSLSAADVFSYMTQQGVRRGIVW